MLQNTQREAFGGVRRLSCTPCVSVQIVCWGTLHCNRSKPPVHPNTVHQAELCEVNKNRETEREREGKRERGHVLCSSWQGLELQRQQSCCVPHWLTAWRLGVQHHWPSYQSTPSKPLIFRGRHHQIKAIMYNAKNISLSNEVHLQARRDSMSVLKLLNITSWQTMSQDNAT